MKIQSILILTALMVTALFGGAADGKVQVVASLEDMADFARQVGGDKVEVYSIFKGQTDAHFFQPLPSHVVKLKKADLLIVGGLEVDAWMKALIDASRNDDIRFGATGYVDPAEGVKPIQVPTGRIQGSMGDVHPFGNPHYWFTEENVKIAVTNIANGLSRVDPENKEYYEKRKDDYLEQVEKTFADLHEKMEKCGDVRIIEYHKSWDYFCKEFGLEVVGSIEPLPGVPPSSSHLAKLIKNVRGEKNLLVIAEPYYAAKPVDFIVRNTGAEALRLPVYLGSDEKIQTYLENLKQNVDKIVDALK